MKFTVHIAKSCASRMRGLSGLSGLQDGRGLLFRFPFPFFWPIWMLGMHFPIDVVWLRLGKVVSACENLSPDTPWRIYFPRQCADECVELAAGEVRKHALTIGTLIEFDKLLSDL